MRFSSHVINRYLLPFSFLFYATVVPHAAFAAPSGPASPVAYVVCGDSQGSGAFVSAADGGYVATVAHVASSGECEVGFVDASGVPQAYYRASIVKSTYDLRTDRDLALLKLGNRIAGPEFKPSSPILTHEFAFVGDSVMVNGYPGADSQVLTTSAGTIRSFGRGSIRMDAKITDGYSGGPILDVQGRLVGLATRVIYETDNKTGVEHILGYEGQDVLTLIAWLDETLGNHDTYVVHADVSAYHARPFVIRSEELGCSYLVRTPEQPTLYCLNAGDLRHVFPNERTYFSWYADYAAVRFMKTSDIASYRLIGNVTKRAGSLVKIQTDPRVYVVTDGIGTLRQIPDERTAAVYFGSDWAKRVTDVPDTFFVDYRIGSVLPVSP